MRLNGKDGHDRDLVKRCVLNWRLKMATVIESATKTGRIRIVLNACSSEQKKFGRRTSICAMAAPTVQAPYRLSVDHWTSLCREVRRSRTVQVLLLLRNWFKWRYHSWKLLQGHFTEYKGRLIISYQLSVVRKRRMEQRQFEPSPERG